MKKQHVLLILLGAIVVIVAAFGARFVKTVAPGHVAVATLFGKVQAEPYGEGLHFPVNPLLVWYDYDAREDQLTESARVPSQDQLQTEIDVTVRYRINAQLAAQILKETGLKDRVVEVHLKPSLRSTLREAGKSIERAEDFFREETQDQLQDYILLTLREDLEPKGLLIDKVFIRRIDLPPFITKAIESKKEREQAVEKQKAELERFRTEQQQQLVQAQAQRAAAEERAAQQRVLADARAYEIEVINKAVAANEAYLQLQALEALKEMAKDPSTKIYFLDGDSPQPLPLMNIGDSLK
ncbi:MAG: SPFH domain-containing protein [Verrucomicrobiota bacterium JB022]|nr:SPFH domain-containing protein [Verrucomicrobiota bacterium JB022]